MRPPTPEEIRAQYVETVARAQFDHFCKIATWEEIGESDRQTWIHRRRHLDRRRTPRRTAPRQMGPGMWANLHASTPARQPRLPHLCWRHPEPAHGRPRRRPRPRLPHRRRLVRHQGLSRPSASRRHPRRSRTPIRTCRWFSLESLPRRYHPAKGRHHDSHHHS